MIRDSMQTMEAETKLEIERSARWLIPILLDSSLVLSIVALLFAVACVICLLFTDPVQFVWVVTDGGLVFNVDAKSR